MGEAEENMAGQGAEITPPGATRLHDKEGGRASWEEPHEKFRARFRKHWRQMLVHLWGPIGSIVFHIVVIGVLVTYATNSGVEEETVSDAVVVETKAEEVLEKPAESGQTANNDADKPKMDTAIDIPTENNVTFSIETPAISTAGQDVGVGSGAGSGLFENKGSEISTMAKNRLVMKGLYSNRNATERKALIAQFGKGGAGGGATEKSVLNALRWLKKNQDADGSWGPVKPAMTGLAVLTFLAHGETPQSIEFGDTVKRAIDWLIANPAKANAYSQAITAYALSEAYGLTQHPAVKDAAINAVKTVVNGQGTLGGFVYGNGPGLIANTNVNDTSVMAWCAQAMKAAKMAGLKEDVPGLESAMKKAIVAFKMNAGKDGGFGYRGPPATGLSGAGALSMQLLGVPRDPDVIKTMKYLSTCTFSFDSPDKQPYAGNRPLYYWYYITQAKFQYSPDAFASWNNMFSPELVKKQILEKDAIEGPDGKMVDIGHWETPMLLEKDKDGKPLPKNEGGGTVMDTCLCTLMLEVYYRYLPSFKKEDGTPEDTAGALPKQDDVTVRIQ